MKRDLLFFSALVASLLALFLIFRNGPEFVDEWVHGGQIEKFARGDWRLIPILTTTPGYHALMVLPVKLTGVTSLAAFRFISFLGGLVGIFFFYRIVAQLWPEERYWRTIQFAYFPVLFPYCFLVYTDLWCLTFVLLAVWLALREKVAASAVAAAIAVAIRQPAIFWAGLIWLGMVIPLRREERVGALKRTWPFLVLFVLFLIFVAWNGGVSLGARSLQSVAFNLTNVWFFLFTVALLFLPDCLLALSTVWKQCRGNRSATIRVALIVGTLWVLFGLSYELSHLFNKINLEYLLHNCVLYAVATQPWARVAALAVIPLGLAGWLLTPLASDRWRWLLPTALASVLVLPYVEPRYYIVPLTLFLALRRPAARTVEIAMTAAYVAFAVWIDVAAFRMWFFP